MVRRDHLGSFPPEPIASFIGRLEPHQKLSDLVGAELALAAIANTDFEEWVEEIIQIKAED